MNYFNLALLGSPKSRSKLQGPNRANKTIALVVGVLATVFLISFIVRAWTEPSVAPPGGNISAPINIGSTAQTKSGNLTVQGQFNAGGLTVGDSFTASIGCADFKIGNSTRRGTPGRAIVDIGPSEIRFNYGGDWTKASIGSDLDVYGNLRVTGLG
ncbi:hypothetical protein AMJ50_02740 [Parcubacteria bacterium DG_74_3]|nr:MAG: hypothetical protein AMJ50_02740 [Parcubacteria bacterium DG_74_3]